MVLGKNFEKRNKKMESVTKTSDTKRNKDAHVMKELRREQATCQ